MRKNKEESLVEECKEIAEETKKITREFENIEDLSEWKW